jgi:N-hydroxyarylamine O-acetyltransferase
VKLSGYLRRIGFSGTARPDLATLRALHRAHQLTVPFENLDVQLRRPTSLDLQQSYEKVVTRRRGGWCYELNGLMAWALREIGFDVMRVSAGVLRDSAVAGAGDHFGTHLCLVVQLDETYFVDVGFGGSLLEPLPLRAVAREDRPYRLALVETPEGYWRFSESRYGRPFFGFDFRIVPADEAQIAAKHSFQQNDPSSGFVQSLVVQRRSLDTHLSLRGRVLTTLHWDRSEQVLLESPEELVTTLRERFDLDAPEVATLWPAICAKHDELFASSRPS